MFPSPRLLGSRGPLREEVPQFSTFDFVYPIYLKFTALDILTIGKNNYSFPNEIPSISLTDSALPC